SSFGDGGPFLSWAMLFALVVRLTALLEALLFAALSRFWSYLLSIGLGLAVGFIWGWGVALILFPFSTFSFPVGFAWIAGGISGMFAAAGLSSRARKGYLPIEVLLTGVVCLGLAFGGNALVIRALDERQVELVFVK